jgi:hypothetical protein
MGFFKSQEQFLLTAQQVRTIFKTKYQLSFELTSKPLYKKPIIQNANFALILVEKNYEASQLTRIQFETHTLSICT